MAATAAFCAMARHLQDKLGIGCSQRFTRPRVHGDMLSTFLRQDIHNRRRGGQQSGAVGFRHHLKMTSYNFNIFNGLVILNDPESELQCSHTPVYVIQITNSKVRFPGRSSGYSSSRLGNRQGLGGPSSSELDRFRKIAIDAVLGLAFTAKYQHCVDSVGIGWAVGRPCQLCQFKTRSCKTYFGLTIMIAEKLKQSEFCLATC